MRWANTLASNNEMFLHVAGDTVQAIIPRHQATFGTPRVFLCCMRKPLTPAARSCALADC
jgi:hypothetical protein